MFPGIGCIFPFLPLHMRKVGLTRSESHTVSAVAPLGKSSFHCQVMSTFAKHVSIVANYNLFQHILDLIKFFSHFISSVLHWNTSVWKKNTESGKYFYTLNNFILTYSSNCVFPIHFWGSKEMKNSVRFMSNFSITIICFCWPYML